MPSPEEVLRGLEDVVRSIGPWVGLFGGGGGLVAIWLAVKRDRREEYGAYFRQLGKERDVLQRQYDRATEVEKDAARERLEAKEAEYVAQSEAYRSNLELRITGPRGRVAQGAEIQINPELLELFAEALPLTPILLEAEDWFIRGNVYIEIGNIDAAIDAYERSLSLKEDPAAFNNLALALYRARRYDDSLEAAKRGAQLDPDDLLGVNNMIAALNSLGKFDEALATANAALTRAPDDPLLRLNRANTYRNLQRYADAFNDLDVAEAAQPRNPVALHSRAATFRDSGDNDRALELFSEAARLDPTNGHYASDCVETLLAMGRIREALEAAMTVAAALENDHDVHNALAHAFAASDRQAEAIPVFQAVLDDRPNDVTALRGITQAFLDIREYERALPYQRRLIGRLPEDGIIAANYVLMLMELGHKREALEWARSAIDEVSNPGALREHLVALLIWNDELDEARRQVETALAQSPSDSARVLQSVVELKAGNLTSARAAIEDSPDSSEINYQRACIESVAGNLERAIALLRSAIEADPALSSHARTDADLEALRTGIFADAFDALLR